MASTSPSLSTTNDSDRTPSLYVGEKAHLLCAYEESIKRCKFVIPGVAYEIQLSQTTPQLTTRKGFKFSYYGRGLNHGDCGVTIHNLTFSNQGQARCIIGTSDNQEVVENVDIRIKNATAWKLPKLALLNNDNALKVGQTLMAECIVEGNDDEDELANLSWHLNNEILTNSSSIQETMRLRRTDEGGKFSLQIKSILKHELRQDDNGKTLKCRLDSFISNFTSQVERELVLEQEADSALPKIGEPYDIVINFTSHPRPSSAKWKVNERNIYYGKSNNGFISREFKYLGNNQWRATLHVTNVTEENFRSNYSLQVNDALGSKSYDVRLDEFDNQQLLNYNTDAVDDLTSSTKVINLDNERNSIAETPSSHETTFDVEPSTYREEINRNSTTIDILTTEATITTLLPTKSTLYGDEVKIVSSSDYNETIEISLDENIDDNSQQQLASFVIASAFITMSIVLIALSLILCYYRKQVVVLKREIIQMSTEHFYNSSSYPGLYNVVNLSLDLRRNALMNISVNSIDVKNDYCVPDYSNSNSNSGSEATNSHLYQSIEEANHVYDEIISTKDEERNCDEKPNNYENNESMNCESIITAIINFLIILIDFSSLSLNYFKAWSMRKSSNQFLMNHLFNDQS